MDRNKGILNITYNYLNLPVSISKSGNTRIEYLYDAAGNKRAQLYYENNTLSKTTDFAGNFVYENKIPSYAIFTEGRIVIAGSNKYPYAEYSLKDHLGNVRVTFRLNQGALQTLQIDSYYPFGMNIKPLSVNATTVNQNKYLYNGKMMQDEMGLNWLDYGARFYDPVLGRWHSVDPLAEEYRDASPYNYTLNNPIKFIDPNGMNIDNYGVDENGCVKFLEKTNDNYDVLYKTKSDDSGKDVKQDTDGEKGISENDGVKVDEGVLDNERTGVQKNNNKEEVGYSYFKVNGDKSATKLFEFLSKNTNVEWSQVKYGSTGNYISTSNSKLYEVGEAGHLGDLFKSNIKVRETIHDHPFKENRRNFRPSPSDFDAANERDKIQKGITYKLYHPQEGYVIYNKNGIDSKDYNSLRIAYKFVPR